MDEWKLNDGGAQTGRWKSDRPNPAPVNLPKRCLVCGQALGLPGGYGGAGMCGPCCTGEAETADECGETW